MHDNLDPAPQWGLTVGLIGKGLIFAAIVLLALSALLWFFRKPGAAKPAFWIGAFCIAAAMGSLIALLMGKQYEYQYVWRNTQNDMPAIYRFSAAWAAQEGSFLLWAMMSAIVAAIAAPFTRENRRWFTIIASCAIIFQLSILAYESPYKIHPELLEAAQNGVILLPPDGNGLNPTLMNYWMAIHPWVIFIGFGSLLTLFAWAFAAILDRDAVSWIPRARPFALFSMTLTGLGLTMGGLWAYETLGWGGFWAWDPVENVSLVPFIAAVALVHGMYLQSHRGVWARWNLFLAMLTFAWFVYGTYLTRSGALVNVSVHSFAEMNQGAHGVLLAMVSIVWAVTIIGAIYAALAKNIRLPESKDEGPRGVGMRLGVFFVYAIGLMAAFGMSLPFFATLFGFQSKIVEEERYNQIVAWAFVPTMILMAVVPFLGWKKNPARTSALSTVAWLSVGLTGAMTFWIVRGGMTIANDDKLPTLKLTLYFFLIWVTLFAISGNAFRIYERIKAKTWNIGPYITHAGVSILLLGLIVSHVFEKKGEAYISTTEAGPFNLAPGKRYLATLDPKWMETFLTEEVTDPNHRLHFTMLHIDASKQAPFNPIFYFNERDGNFVIRPVIMRRPLYDLYFFVKSLLVAYGDPIQLKPGETKKVAGFTVTFIRPTMSGDPGQPGTTFGAELKIENETMTTTVMPTIELGEGGRINRPIAPVFEDLNVVLEGLDANTQTATVSLNLPEPLFATELFFKPLTVLVWIGTGMMTLGGFITINRRRKDAGRLQQEADATDPTA